MPVLPQGEGRLLMPSGLPTARIRRAPRATGGVRVTAAPRGLRVGAGTARQGWRWEERAARLVTQQDPGPLGWDRGRADGSAIREPPPGCTSWLREGGDCCLRCRRQGETDGDMRADPVTGVAPPVSERRCALCE